MRSRLAASYARALFVVTLLALDATPNYTHKHKYGLYNTQTHKYTYIQYPNTNTLIQNAKTQIRNTQYTLLALNGRRIKLDTQSLTETVCYTTNTVNCMYASVYTEA